MEQNITGLMPQNIHGKRLLKPHFRKLGGPALSGSSDTPRQGRFRECSFIELLLAWIVQDLLEKFKLHLSNCKGGKLLTTLLEHGLVADVRNEGRGDAEYPSEAPCLKSANTSQIGLQEPS